MSEKPILRLANIESSYGPITAIRGISLDLMAGHIVTVLGANGAGKTTILKTISGVIAPQKGSIEFEGRRIEGMEPDAVVRLGISHVPEGREVFPFLSIRDNLRMGAYIRRDQRQIAQDMEKVFDYFPVLRERQEQIAGQLSGGQQQMLAISRALMSRPKVLLLDEPSLGLSPLLVKEIFAIIRRLNVEDGVTILGRRRGLGGHCGRGLCSGLLGVINCGCGAISGGKPNRIAIQYGGNHGGVFAAFGVLARVK